MLNLTRAIDRATGYIFIPPPTSSAPPGTIPPPPTAPKTALPNTYALFSTAAGPLQGPGSNVRDIQERWIDAKDEWDAFEKVQWRKEGEMVRDEAAKKAGKIRERKGLVK
jgi:GPN-loop GTPase